MDNYVIKEDVLQFAEHFELWEDLRGRTFLITGATGLIGSVMVKCLLALNHLRKLDIKIIAVVRNIEKAKKVFSDEYDYIDFRVMELNNMSVNTINTHVDYIIHLASPTASKFFVEHPVETLRTAIEGTTTVMEYARATKTQSMVYASSLEVYGTNNTNNWLDEQFQGYLNPTEVRSSYNMGKRAAECLCHSYAKEYAVPVKIARMTQTFGAGIEYNDNRVFAQFARKAIENEDIELHTSGETRRMYCYTTDAVSAMLYLLLRGVDGEAYNIANKDSYISIRDMADLVREHFNKDISVVVNHKEGQGYAPQTMLRLDTSKVEKLGWKPRHSLEIMFERLIAYMNDIKCNA